MEREGGVKAAGRVVPGLRTCPVTWVPWSLCLHRHPGASAPAAALPSLEGPFRELCPGGVVSGERR